MEAITPDKINNYKYSLKSNLQHRQDSIPETQVQTAWHAVLGRKLGNRKPETIVADKNKLQHMGFKFRFITLAYKQAMCSLISALWYWYWHIYDKAQLMVLNFDFPFQICFKLYNSIKPVRTMASTYIV